MCQTERDSIEYRYVTDINKFIVFPKDLGDKPTAVEIHKCYLISYQYNFLDSTCALWSSDS